jgi:hypothetical protein
MKLALVETPNPSDVAYVLWIEGKDLERAMATVEEIQNATRQADDTKHISGQLRALAWLAEAIERGESFHALKQKALSQGSHEFPTDA